jgi:hypothetical protein
MSALVENSALYVNAPYPPNVNVNKEVLGDIENGLSDGEIIQKLQNTPNLMVALWGEGDVNQQRYVPLHHAASRVRIELTLFILSNLLSPELVNLENDNFFTPLRYAYRANSEQMVQILLNHGAVEVRPPINLRCVCGNDFVFTPDKQARYSSRGYQDPKHCGNCLANKKAQQQQQGGGGGGRGMNSNFRQHGGGDRGNNFRGGRGGGYGGDFGNNNNNRAPRGGFEPRNNDAFDGRGGFDPRGAFDPRANQFNGQFNNPQYPPQFNNMMDNNAYGANNYNNNPNNNNNGGFDRRGGNRGFNNNGGADNNDFQRGGFPPQNMPNNGYGYNMNNMNMNPNMNMNNGGGMGW